MTTYGRSSWVDGFPKSRVPAVPPQKGVLKADAVIVGGPLTGCATAYAFAAAGVKVVLVGAEQIGRGNSGSSSGWIADEPGVDFVDLEKAIGRRGARSLFRDRRNRRPARRRSNRSRIRCCRARSVRPPPTRLSPRQPRRRTRWRTRSAGRPR